MTQGQKHVFFVFHTIDNRSLELLEVSFRPVLFEEQKQNLEGYHYTNNIEGSHFDDTKAPIIRWCHILRTREEAVLMILRLFISER